MIPESNLKLMDHSAEAFDLPAAETLPSGRCCCVRHQGITEWKKGGEAGEPAVSLLLTSLTLCVATHIPASALYPGRIDPYGFERPRDYESYKDMMDEYVVILNRRSMRWSKLLQEKPQVEKNVTGTDSNQGTKSVFGALCCSVMNIFSFCFTYLFIYFLSEKVRS